VKAWLTKRVREEDPNQPRTSPEKKKLCMAPGKQEKRDMGPQEEEPQAVKIVEIDTPMNKTEGAKDKQIIDLELPMAVIMVDEQDQSQPPAPVTAIAVDEQDQPQAPVPEPLAPVVALPVPSDPAPSPPEPDASLSDPIVPNGKQGKEKNKARKTENERLAEAQGKKLHKALSNPLSAETDRDRRKRARLEEAVAKNQPKAGNPQEGAPHVDQNVELGSGDNTSTQSQ
jgi:hypothetical protein